MYMCLLGDWAVVRDWWVTRRALPRYLLYSRPSGGGYSIKKSPLRHIVTGFSVLSAWQCPTFAWNKSTLSSALSSFTSEFEMGSGGAYSLWPPGKLAPHGNSVLKRFLFSLCCAFALSLFSSIIHSKTIERYIVKPHGQLVQVSSTHYCAYTPCLSTL